MATPVGHALFGITCALFFKRHRPDTTTWRCYVLAVIAANAPDFDFIPGLLLGNINQFHQGLSHSLLAALFFGLASLLISKWLKTPPIQTALLGFLAYTSHLVLDMFANDSRAPFGIPMFWPVNQAYLQFPITLFPGVKHGVPGDSLSVVLSEIFSITNLTGVLVEILIMTPILFVALYLSKRPAYTSEASIQK